MYYPLLKNSNNEMKALRYLKDDSRPQVTPIIESKRVKKNNVVNWESSFKTLGTFLKERVKDMKFIYDFNCALEELGEENQLVTTSGENLVKHCLEKMESQELNVIPCFQHDSPSWLVDSVINSNYKEVAIRIRCHDFQESFNPFVLQKLKADLEQTKPDTKVIVILDFFNQPTSIQRLQNTIDTFSKINNSELVYIATSCPDNASDANPHSVTLIGPRREFNNFLELRSKKYNVSFGDYTTRLKGEVLNGFNFNNSYLKVFYSTETDYWIAKSKLIKDDGESTFHEVCQQLLEYDFYPGAEFSFGDAEIYKCANKEIVISDHQAPIAIGVNHHIETTVAQLTGFNSPSSSLYV
ncbi:beta family protein [Priestia megaterium]|uniref:beta family protein n=1 Tax=Priestia megaterium TaxID=1404 RepID=UPI003D96F4C3